MHLLMLVSHIAKYATLLYGSESQPYIRSQRLNSTIRLSERFFRSRLLYHRVLTPSEEQCSNEYLPKLRAHAKIQPSSQHIQASRLVRHDAQLRNKFCFNAAHDYLQFSRRRVGAPGIHWAELAMTEASNRHQYLLQQRVLPRVYEHSLVHCTPGLPGKISPIIILIASAIPAYIDPLRPLCHDRSQWRQLVIPR